MATIKEIAALAGVSPSTVSNVLHGKHAKVSPATLKKVRSILKAQDYAPNMGAIILAHSSSRIIGVIMFIKPRSGETVLEDPFTAAILGVMEREIRQSGYFMMLHATADPAEVLRLAATWKLDGLIVLWVPGEIAGRIRGSVSAPVVFIDCYSDDDGQPHHNIGLDDERGGYEMTAYLLSMGHERIAFLANDDAAVSGDRARFEGCKRAFRERGLALDEGCFIPLPKDGAVRRGLYDRLITKPLAYTTLFFSADYYAADAVDYFTEKGLVVPRDISVAGFDDNIFSRLIRPRLSTVRQDVASKGRHAVSLLLKLMKKQPVSESDVRLPVWLVIRDSVRRLGRESASER